jgi:hypothetical protein
MNQNRAMEADVLWKAAMRPRLATGLGKRRQEAAGVFHISHSPCQRPKNRAASAVEAGSAFLILTINPTGQFTC